MKLPARLTWSTMDQGLNSLGTLVLTFGAARALEPTDFGTFATMTAAVILAMQVAQALTSEVHLVHHRGGDRESWRTAAGGAVSTSMILGVAAAPIAVALGWFALRTGLTVAVVLGVTVLGSLMWEAVRLCSITGHRPSLAAWTSGSSLALLVVVFACFSPDTLESVTVSWFVSVALPTVVVLVWARVPVGVRRGLVWWRIHARASGSYVAESISLAAGSFAVIGGLGLVAGLAEAGAYRAAQALFGPLNVLINALRLGGITELAHRSNDDQRALRKGAELLSLGGFVVALGYGLVVIVLHEPLAKLLLGPTAALVTVGLVVATAVSRVASTFGLGPLAGLRLVHALRVTAVVRISGGFVLAALGVLGGAAAGATGATWGVAAAMTITAAMLWVLFVRLAGRDDAAVGDRPVRPRLGG